MSVVGSTRTIFYMDGTGVNIKIKSENNTIVDYDTKFGGTGAYYNVEDHIRTESIGTLADDATPSILGHNTWLTGGTTTITDFDDGQTSQIITIIAEHALTITDGTNIFLSGSANWTMAATDTLTLICKADNKWYELSRSDNT